MAVMVVIQSMIIAGSVFTWFVPNHLKLQVRAGADTNLLFLACSTFTSSEGFQKYLARLGFD